MLSGYLLMREEQTYTVSSVADVRCHARTVYVPEERERQRQGERELRSGLPRGPGFCACGLTKGAAEQGPL